MNPEFLEIAHRIGARLCRDALWSEGRCNWTGQYMDGETLAYAALGSAIYSGTSGIALFLWRLAEATGDRIVRLTAHAALRQALSTLPHPGCGLYAGGLGILFAASQIHCECDDDALLRQAEPDPRTLDLIGGSAGAIAVLLHLYRARGGLRWLEAAARHGDLLLAEAERADNGWSWKTSHGSRNLTGFSHGTAGIGWALCELWNATGEARFRAAALEAFRYERSCFNPSAPGWPDYRLDPPTYPGVWCHGLGGIAFSRLRAWQLLGHDDLLEEARIALATVVDRLNLDASFCLCHGAGGNADLLLYAAHVLGKEHWRDRAIALGREAAAYFERRGQPWRCGLPESNEMPGLMLGMAGIGYFYLRLADPARIPTVLLPGS
jgi:type 2 lantibiotic biosynthesis protein LanM